MTLGERFDVLFGLGRRAHRPAECVAVPATQRGSADEECCGCRPEVGEVLRFCLVHGRCEGCQPAQGVWSRMCPMHGVVAEDERERRRRDS